MIKKIAVSHNVYFKIFRLKNTISCADFACKTDILCIARKRKNDKK